MIPVLYVLLVFQLDAPLIGILVEVVVANESRQTLSYAIRELEKDVSEQAKKSGRENEETTFGIFVLHNKHKPKRGILPDDLINERYWAAEHIHDLWVSTSRVTYANLC